MPQYEAEKGGKADRRLVKLDGDCQIVIKKEKISVTLNKMATAPEDVLTLYEHMMLPSRTDKEIKQFGLDERSSKAKELRRNCQQIQLNLPSEMKILFHKIFSYGTEKAISCLLYTSPSTAWRAIRILTPSRLRISPMRRCAAPCATI